MNSVNWLSGRRSKHAARAATFEEQLETSRRTNNDLKDQVSNLQTTVDQRNRVIEDQTHQHREALTKVQRSLSERIDRHAQTFAVLEDETSLRYSYEREKTYAEERAVKAERALCLQRGTHSTELTSDGEDRSKHAMVKQPFLLVLIDGDAYHFQDKYVAAGTQGGANLAQDIRNEVMKFMETKPHKPQTCEIVVRMFMNKDNTCSVTTRRLGEGLMWFFDACVTNATQTISLFDVIDCGTGKERVDTKIHGMLYLLRRYLLLTLPIANFHLFIKNSDCQYIMLGACLDNGFVRLLEPYVGNLLLEHKITLLTLGTVAPEFTNLIQPKGPFQTIRWPSIFRERLDSNRRRGGGLRRSAPRPSPLTIAPRPGSEPSAKSSKSNSPATPNTPKQDSPSTITRRVLTTNTRSSDNGQLSSKSSNSATNSEMRSKIGSRRASTSNGASNTQVRNYFPAPKILDLQVHRNVAAHPTIDRWQPLYTVNGARVDHPWKRSALPGDRVMSHMVGKTCYEHVIFGRCNKGLKCASAHGDLDDDLREGIRWHLQRTPCVKGPRCRRRTCVNGHSGLDPA